MDSPRLDRSRLAFLIGVPLAWAVLLVFHPTPDGGDVYGSIRDDASRFLIVHLGMLVFIGLMGVAVLLLLQGLSGAAARISRVALGPFVLFYGAGEAIAGIATGVLVEHANDVAAADRAAAAGAVQELWDKFITADLLLGIGGFAWIVAVVAAAVAIRHAGAPVVAAVLVGLSAIASFHAPPLGPIGLLCFAGGIAVLAFRSRAEMAAGTPAPA
jgi:hypothetical protein